jgi:HEXXH motif-containing protein
MRHLLWSDTGIFDARHEKSAAALVAIAQTVAELERPRDEEREFLRLYDACLAVEPEAFTRVWTEPRAYAWVRTAFERAGADPAQLAHLAGFGRFALAAHHLARRDLAFARPLRLTLPLAVPGTRLSLSGAGTLAVAALADGRLRGYHEREPFDLPLGAGARSASGRLKVEECPVVREGGCELRLQPHAFHDLPGLDFLRPVVDAGVDFHREHQDLVAEALRVWARYDARSFAQFREHAVLLGLKPLRVGSFTNHSHSDLPGAAVVSVVHEPFELADSLIHEFHHDRLFFLEERGPFFKDPSAAAVDGHWYSPWRDDLRPLHGILHALYVFVPVCRYWLHVHRAGDAEEAVRAYARSQAARTALQLSLAASQLEQHAEFTAFGRRVFEEMGASVARLWNDLREAGLDPRQPALRCSEDGSIVAETADGRALRVEEAVRRHLEAHAPDAQREALRRSLRACAGDERSRRQS